MPHKIVVGHDGSASAKGALDFAVDLASKVGASIVIAHVLEWSPYTFLTQTELAERHQRRKEELARAEEALLKPIVDSLKDSGIDISTSLKYGHIADTLCFIVQEENADQIVIGRTGQTDLTSRLFGSVAGSLAQSSPVPVTIVP